MPAWAIWMPIVGGLMAYVLGWGLVFVADLVQRRDAPGRSVWIAPGVAFVGTVGLCVLFCVDKAPGPDRFFGVAFLTAVGMGLVALGSFGSVVALTLSRALRPGAPTGRSWRWVLASVLSWLSVGPLALYVVFQMGLPGWSGLLLTTLATALSVVGGLYVLRPGGRMDRAAATVRSLLGLATVAMVCVPILVVSVVVYSELGRCESVAWSLVSPGVVLLPLLVALGPAVAAGPTAIRTHLGILLLPVLTSSIGYIPPTDRPLPRWVDLRGEPSSACVGRLERSGRGSMSMQPGWYDPDAPATDVTTPLVVLAPGRRVVALQDGLMADLEVKRCGVGYCVDGGAPMDARALHDLLARSEVLQQVRIRPEGLTVQDVVSICASAPGRCLLDDVP